MGADDAPFAEMRRPLTEPDADPLALDDRTVERLLAGDLPPSQVPPGYEQVAALLVMAAAAPTRRELAGQAAVLAELRALTRPGRAAASTRRAARPPRRRWAGLAAVALVGVLATGGVAAGASGNLPAPVRDVARSIVGADAEPATPEQPGGLQPAPAAPAPASAGATAGPKGPLATGSTTPGSGPKGAGPVAEPDKEGLCRAFLVSQDKEHGKKMDAPAFKRLAEAAGGASRIPAYCKGTRPGGPGPNGQKRQDPPGGEGQGQGGSGPGNDGGQGRPISGRS